MKYRNTKTPFSLLYHAGMGNFGICFAVNLRSIKALIPEAKIEGWADVHRQSVVTILENRFASYHKAGGYLARSSGQDYRPAGKDKRGRYQDELLQCHPDIYNFPDRVALDRAILLNYFDPA